MYTFPSYWQAFLGETCSDPQGKLSSIRQIINCDKGISNYVEIKIPLQI